jgi:SAM-dependent methyltransferase
MRVVGVVGSNLDQFQCPWCGCHDRERHLFMYMTAVGLLPKMAGMSVLHFAPERRLSPRILAANPKHYVQCDLYPQSPDVMQVDMLNMPFENSSFDLSIANHVLEHVSDDQQALAEITRVLKPGGYAILQTPYSWKLHQSWSDPGIDTDEARLQAYGQEDHVRLYGRDIIERFESFGLTARVKQHHETLTQIDATKFGVNESEPFFLFQKR